MFTCTASVSHWSHADGGRASGHMGRRLLVRTTVLSASKPARPKRSLSLHGVAPGEYDWSRPQKMHAQQGGGGGVEQVVETLYG